ncbi:MAG TPA: cyclic nucleotide-binding domain-containing protein [Pyrinomonadaceae bacterium]|jgi:CRP-like cAMP-binding protein
MNDQYAALITELDPRISLDEAQELIASGQIKEQVQGTVMSQGAPASADSVLFLLTGKFEVFVTLEGKDVVVGKLNPGNFLGAEAVLGRPRNASVRTSGPSVVLEWSLLAFRNLLRHSPSLSEKILEQSLPPAVGGAKT